MEFIGEHPEIVLGFIAILMGIVTYFLRRLVGRIVLRLDKLEEDVKDIRHNYLNRFDDVKDHQRDQAMQTRADIADLSIKLTEILAKVETQTKFCQFVQEQKQKGQIQ